MDKDGLREIRAVIRPARVARLREALRALPDGPGMTVLEARGYTEPAQLNKRTLREELTDFSDKALVLILVPAVRVDEIVGVIQQACSTNQLGDGVIWVIDVSSSMRVTSLSS